MHKGTVKFYNEEKGFGFIQRENAQDLFFHCSKIEASEIVKGDKVEFEIGKGKKGPEAIQVRLASVTE